MYPDGFGTRCIQATFFIFSLVVPLLHLVLLLVLWLAPLTARVQKKLYLLAEVLNAWSGLDVFVLSLLAALLEINRFAQFIVGDKCNIIKEILEKYFNNAFEGLCFEVIPSLDTGCWLLFGAAILYFISGTLVMRACHAALEKAETIAMNRYRPLRKIVIEITNLKIFMYQ